MLNKTIFSPLQLSNSDDEDQTLVARTQFNVVFSRICI